MTNPVGQAALPDPLPSERISPPTEGAPLQANAVHYQALCAMCLGIVFLAQMQQGLLLTNLLSVAIGGWVLVSRMRAGPTLFLLFLAGSQFAHHLIQTRGGLGRRSYGVDIGDVVLCAAVLGFVLGHYRLQAIWLNALPLDPRQRTGEPRRRFPWLWRSRNVSPEKRRAEHITPLEIAWLVMSLPIWALVAQVAWSFVPDRPNVVGLPPRLGQIVLVAWALGLGAFVMVMALSYWRHRRRTRTQALLYLQDALWRQTRGEQRRIGRWLAWWQRRRRQEDVPKGVV